MTTTKQMTELNKENHDDIVNGEQPVLVKFHATWCGPCKAMAPAIAELATEFSEKLRVVEVDIDKNPELVKQYSIQAVPTLVLLKAGEVVERLTGGQFKSGLSKILESHLAS